VNSSEMSAQDIAEQDRRVVVLKCTKSTTPSQRRPQRP
jgi:hypothetical protein